MATRNMPHQFTNESRKYRILHATKWSKGKAGLEVKTRLVVLAFTPQRGYGDYAVRMQNYDGATHGGSAYNSAREAHDEFLQAYLKHNRSYREGNVSHYPGIAK